MRQQLPIEGMTCGGCVRSVTRALEQVPGVERVEVELEAKRATVEGEVTRDALVRAIEDAGFDVPAAG